jgi:hypothetical protein
MVISRTGAVSAEDSPMVLATPSDWEIVTRRCLDLLASSTTDGMLDLLEALSPDIAMSASEIPGTEIVALFNAAYSAAEARWDRDQQTLDGRQLARLAACARRLHLGVALPRVAAAWQALESTLRMLALDVAPHRVALLQTFVQWATLVSILRAESPVLAYGP